MKPVTLIQALAVAALLAVTPAQAQKIKVGYWTSGFSLGFGAVMEQMKFAEKEGLDVEWVKFAEVNGPTRAIVPQTIDLAFGAPSTASMSIAADGVPVKIVLASQIAEAQIVVPADSPIKSIADLKGKKIGMSPPGSPTHAIASSVLQGVYGLKAGDSMITNASRAGARAGIVYNYPDRITDDDITAVINAYCRNYLITFGSGKLQAPDITRTGTSSGDSLTVTVRYRYEFLVLPNFIGTLIGGMEIMGQTVMRME